MKKICWFIFLLISCFSLVAQPAIEWGKCFGGSHDERAYAAMQATNGDYLMVGKVASSNGNVSGFHGGYDMWIIRIDTVGNLIWQKCYGGSSGEQANAISETFDKGFIIAGSSLVPDGDVTGSNGGADCWVVKTDSSGNILWQRSYGGSNHDQAYSIIQTQDSGYIFVANTNSNDSDVTGNHGQQDIWVVKLDSAGNIQWQNCWGGTYHELANTVRQLQNGNYVISGTSGSNDGNVTGSIGFYDYWFLKLGPAGNLISQKCFGGTESEFYPFFDLTPDGGYLVSGTSISNDVDVSGNLGWYDAWVIRLDSSFNLIWQKCLGGSSDEFNSFARLTPDGGCIVATTTVSQQSLLQYNYHGWDEIELIKLDSLQNIEWQWCYGGSDNEEVWALLLTTDNNFLVAGSATSNNNGDVTGNHSSLDTYGDFWVFKTGNTIAVNPDLKHFPFSLSPNPTTGKLNLENIDPGFEEITLFNNLGEKMLEAAVTPEEEITIDISSLTPGIYILQASGEGKILRRKVVKQ